MLDFLGEAFREGAADSLHQDDLKAIFAFVRGQAASSEGGITRRNRRLLRYMRSRAELWGVIDEIKPDQEALHGIPGRIVPDILLTEPNAPIHVLSGPFRLVGSSDAQLDADLVFRWFPSARLEFEGMYKQAFVDIGYEEWTLESKDDAEFSVPVHVTEASPGPEWSFVRGSTTRPFNLGRGPIHTLRFYLVNFPEYIGTSVR